MEVHVAYEGDNAVWGETGCFVEFVFSAAEYEDLLLLRRWRRFGSLLRQCLLNVRNGESVGPWMLR